MKAHQIKYTITINLDGYEKTLNGSIGESFFKKDNKYADYTEEELYSLIEYCINLDTKSLIRTLHI